jgi:hypothetical protein
LGAILLLSFFAIELKRRGRIQANYISALFAGFFAGRSPLMLGNEHFRRDARLF